MQVDQKGPTPFIAKRREMGPEKGSASAALSKVGAGLRVQPKSSKACLDALATGLSFLLWFPFQMCTFRVSNPSQSAQNLSVILLSFIRTKIFGFPPKSQPTKRSPACLGLCLEQIKGLGWKQLWRSCGHFQEGEDALGAAGRL